MNKIFKTAGADIPASIVVFLVALPLCLGVAQASGAPLFAGIIAGVVGGILIGFLSGSSLSISGPAAGLTGLVATALKDLPTFQIFLLSVVIAGCIQILLGFLKAGIIGDFIPNCVIKGMLASIGIILILKELPHLVGYDKEALIDETFDEASDSNIFYSITSSFKAFTTGAIIIGAISFAILMLWELKAIKQKKIFQLIPAPLIVVVLSIAINQLFLSNDSAFALKNGHLVNLPVTDGIQGFASLFTMPDFSGLTNPKVWTIGLTIAVVASLETLLSIEAVDKLDPLRRVTPNNRELKAQGIGNLVSGMLGGLPTTAVIVRSSANVNAGGRTKMSAILHGIFLLLSAMFLATLINKIPVTALAAILIFTGYKLAKPALFKELYKRGFDQFIPFIATVVVTIITRHLLYGIVAGIIVSLYFLLRSGFKSSVFIVSDANKYMIRLRKDVSFLNKSLIKTQLEKVPANSFILIDASRADFIDKDVIEEINNFILHAHLKNIKVEVKKGLNKPAHKLLTDTEFADLADRSNGIMHPHDVVLAH